MIGRWFVSFALCGAAAVSAQQPANPVQRLRASIESFDGVGSMLQPDSTRGSNEGHYPWTCSRAA